MGRPTPTVHAAVAASVTIKMGSPPLTGQSFGVSMSAHQEGCADHQGLPICFVTESLNSDPYNLRAEEQALEECTLGVEVRRMWSEVELVRSIDGRLFPGTPDGMFENWDGALTCVQVVRVPLVPEMCMIDMSETLSQTVLTKVVKSQYWLRASHVVPHDFIIFCWLPLHVPGAVRASAEALMHRIQLLDPRFSLRLRLPADANALFPPLFACRQLQRLQAPTKSLSETDVSTFNGSDTDSDEEEECTWDLTWDWCTEYIQAAGQDPSGSVGSGNESESGLIDCDVIIVGESNLVSTADRRGSLKWGDMEDLGVAWSFDTELSADERRSIWDDGG